MPGRWLTDPAADGPAAVRPAFTAVESDTFVKILTFARNPANADMELLHCLDGAGTRVLDTSSGHKAAPLTDAMRAAIAEGERVRLWHNHPSQDSLSHSDWLCAGTSAELEVLALNQHGSIFVGRIPDWDDRLHELLALLPELGAELELYMSRLAKARGLDLGLEIELSMLTGHVLNCALAKCTTVRYAYWLVNGDDRVIAACASAGVTCDGLALAVGAIEEQMETARLTAAAPSEPRPQGPTALMARDARSIGLAHS